jgi:hypothetical protein
MDQPINTVPESTPDLNSGTVCLSSNATLFWRVFVPAFGTVFVTGLLLGYWLIDEEEFHTNIPILYTRILITLLWLGWFFLILKTVWKLKRIDANDHFVFITNYWTSVRYPWADVEKITPFRRAGRQLLRIHLKAPGRFGATVAFLPGRHYQSWMEEHGKTEFST